MSAIRGNFQNQLPERLTLGESLQGFVTPFMGAEFDAPAPLAVEIVGFARISWVAKLEDPDLTPGERDHILSGRSLSINEENEFWVLRQELAPKKVWSKGAHAYSVEISTVPDTLPPTTNFTDPFTREQLSIRYVLRTWFGEGAAFERWERPLEVVPAVLTPPHLQPLHLVQGIPELGLSISLKTSGNRWRSGEDHIILFEGQNDSANVTQVLIQLHQNITLLAGHGTKLRSLERMISTTELPGIRAADKLSAKVKLTLPPLPPSVSVRGIEIRYIVEAICIFKPLDGGQPPSLSLVSEISILDAHHLVNLPPNFDDQIDVMTDIPLSLPPLLAASAQNAPQPMPPGYPPPSSCLQLSFHSSFKDNLFQEPKLYYYDVEPTKPSDKNAAFGGKAAVDTIVVHSNAEVLLRISRDAISTFWQADINEESSSQLANGTIETTARLSYGPGRYFIVVFPAYNPGPGSNPVSIHIQLRKTFAIGELTEADFDEFWVDSSPGKLPADAWVAGTDLDGKPVHCGRATGADRSLCPGSINKHSQFLQVVDGHGIHDATGQFQVMRRIPGTTWQLQVRPGIPPNGVPVGHHADGQLLYLARSRISGRFVEENRFADVVGKAGFHTGGFSAAFYDDQLHGIVPYEVLVWDPVEAEAEKKAMAQ
ncbi:uncharacterized protein BJ171DRAFT_492264 [Polychytrium aggregatum]|uniref:uncharacterized protein n=1 Tax=Polychytrium aggregatum TaxID=110093 RepID=UPI0022FF3D7E|nr:uncharacterized protein BJ171DRAFT_492264 [Polychytrium aggregatum]KAI9207971.1 hypothetical protein BJ171DRAFT_492264 [Polychytrium aggregatum]